MDDEERSDGRFVDDAHFQIPCAAAEFLENGVYCIGFGKEFIFMLQNGKLCQMDVDEIEHLHLPDHVWLCGGGLESAAGAGELCHKGSACYYRRLFQRHGDQHIL